MAKVSRRTWRRIRAAALWLAIPALILLWTNPVDATTRALVSATYVIFILLAAPVWCAAPNRDGTYCRNNATGLLVGCHLRYHRWQKMKTLVRPNGVRSLGQRLFRDVTSGAAVVSAIGALISAAAAWVQALLSG